MNYIASISLFHRTGATKQGRAFCTSCTCSANVVIITSEKFMQKQQHNLSIILTIPMIYSNKWHINWNKTKRGAGFA